MAKYIFFATVEIEEDSEDDARIELDDRMDSHSIHWELEDVKEND